MQTEVARIFPDSQPSSGRYGKRRHIKTSCRGKGGRGDGKVRGRFEDRKVEVGITEILELVEEAVASLIRKIELSSVI